MFNSKGKFIKSTKEGSTRYMVWSHSDKPVVYYNRVGTSAPTVFTHYFYTCPERSRRDAAGNRVEVTFYMDGGLFETTYVKPNGTSIDNNRFYNTLHVLDGSSRIATIRVGRNDSDSTPAIKYNIEDHLGNSTVVLTTTGGLVNREETREGNARGAFISKGTHEVHPFGETAFGAFRYKRYRFNGKEKDATELKENVRGTFLAKGRDCRAGGLYNYGQRYYAPWLHLTELKKYLQCDLL